MGLAESHALFSTPRKNEVEERGPHPDEPRTEDDSESIWL